MCIVLILTSQFWPMPSAVASVYATCRHRWQGTCSRVILTCSGSSSQPFGIAGGAAKLRGLVGPWPLVNGSKWWWLRFNKSYQQINGGLLLKPLVFWPISLAWAYPWCESVVAIQKFELKKKPTRCAWSCRAAGAIATATTVAPYLPKDSNHFRLNGGLQPVYRARYPRFLVFTPLLSSWSIVNWSDPPHQKKKGASLGILSGSSSRAHSFLHHSSIFALLHTDFRLSLSCISQLLLFISLGLYVQGHLLSYFASYTLSLYWNSLVEIFMVHSPAPCFLRLLLLSLRIFYDYTFAALSQPI